MCQFEDKTQCPYYQQGLCGKCLDNDEKPNFGADMRGKAYEEDNIN